MANHHFFAFPSPANHSKKHHAKITPFLWFDHQAEAAAKFYVSVFKNSKIKSIVRYGADGPGKPGSVMIVDFRLNGQEFTALNGGPEYRINPAISFVVHCRTQKEVDCYWKKLTAGGKPIQCGWLTDKFGVSWQIVPEFLLKNVAGKNPAKTRRMMQAMMQMVKLDLAKLKRAYDGK